MKLFSSEAIPTKRTKPAGMRLRRFVSLDNLSVVVLAVLLLKYLWDIESHQDVSFIDEQGYLLRGMAFNVARPESENGPLYSFFYYLLSLGTTDAPTLQFIATKCVTFFVVVTFFLVLRQLRVPVGIALFLSWLYMVGPLLLPIFPKVGFAANGIFFLGAVFFLRQSSAIGKWSIASICFLLCAYFRPEFRLAFALAMVVLTWVIIAHIRKQQWKRKSIYFISAPIVLTIILSVAFGNPFVDKTNRTFLAFGQHYAYNQHNVRKDDLNPFINWRYYVDEKFGSVNSIGGAIAANPSEFANHVLLNVKNYLWMTAEYGTGLLWPNIYFDSIGKLSIVIFLVGIVILFVLGIRSGRTLKDMSVPEIAHCLIFFGIAFLVGLAGQLLVAPRHHTYAYQMFFPVLFASTLFFGLTRLTNFLGSKAVFFAIAILLFLVTPVPRNNPLLAKEQPILTLIRKLQNLDKTLVVLDPVGTIGEYAGKESKSIQIEQKNGDFSSFLKTEQINFVIVTPSMTLDPRYKHDESFSMFINHPEKFGFGSMEYSSPMCKLFASTDILPAKE